MRTLAACLGMLVLAAVVASGSAAAAPQKLTVYSVANAVQYINNADDSARGKINNPFSTATNKLQPHENTKGNGPFAGDVAVYSFNLFTSPSLKKSAGTASYTCYYNYDKKALCQAYFKLGANAGTLTASGPVDFDQTGFKLVVTGGTQHYLGMTGQMKAASAPKNSQRLDFLLLNR